MATSDAAWNAGDALLAGTTALLGGVGAAVLRDSPMRGLGLLVMSVLGTTVLAVNRRGEQA